MMTAATAGVPDRALADHANGPAIRQHTTELESLERLAGLSIWQVTSWLLMIEYQ
jgi:hypothetical protein